MGGRHRPGGGFTLLELIVVLAVIGILATLALPKLQNVPRRARESTLRNNLHTIRAVLDQHKADKGIYPESLEVLEEEGYLRKVPVDPITKRRDTWVLILDQSDSEDPPPEVDDDKPPGVIDVKSGAEGTTLDGVPYGEL